MGRFVPATYSSALETAGKSHLSFTICYNDSSENKVSWKIPYQARLLYLAFLYQLLSYGLASRSLH